MSLKIILRIILCVILCVLKPNEKLFPYEEQS